MSAEDQENVLGNELELIRITEDLYDEVIKFHLEYFMGAEPVCVALGLHKSESAKKEAAVVARKCLEYGVSFAIRQRSTNEIVAIRINNILQKTDDKPDFKFESDFVVALTVFVEPLKATYDLFKEWNLDCVFEFLFLATRPDFAKRGLALFLSQYALNFARQMAQGTLKEINDLPERVRQLKPQAVCCIYSSCYSRKVGEKIGMQILSKMPYTDFPYEDKTLADIVNPIHQYALYTAKKL